MGPCVGWVSGYYLPRWPSASVRAGLDVPSPILPPKVRTETSVTETETSGTRSQRGGHFTAPSVPYLPLPLC